MFKKTKMNKVLLSFFIVLLISLLYAIPAAAFITGRNYGLVDGERVRWMSEYYYVRPVWNVYFDSFSNYRGTAMNFSKTTTNIDNGYLVVGRDQWEDWIALFNADYNSVFPQIEFATVSTDVGPVDIAWLSQIANVCGWQVKSWDNSGWAIYEKIPSDSDGDNPTDPNQPPVALFSWPSSCWESDTVNVSENSKDYDGEIVSWSWSLSPTTGTTRNLAKGGGTVTLSTSGTYSLKLTVEDDDGERSSTTHSITVNKPIPKAVIDYSGSLKENRKVTLDSTHSSSPAKFPVVTSQDEWAITPVNGGTEADIKIGTKTGAAQEVLFKKAGTYRVGLRVHNSLYPSDWVYTDITILPDEPPIADFLIPSSLFRKPADQNYASIKLTDKSFSGDGDTIAQRVWRYKFDSDNDGDFSDETWIVFDSGNNVAPALRTNHIGKYLFELEVKENFGQPTIPEYITDVDYKTDDTIDKPQVDKVTDVKNIAPSTSFSVINNKKVDIVVMVALNDTTKAANLSAKLDTYIKSKLLAGNVDVNIQLINRTLKVLEIYPGHPELKPVSDKYNAGNFVITSISADTFNAANPDLSIYDVVVFGFANRYGSRDLTTATSASLTNYANQFGGVVVSHDTPFELPVFESTIIPFLYNSSKHHPTANTTIMPSISKVTSGSLTDYPYILPSTIFMAPNHRQYYGLKTGAVKWYKLDGLAPTEYADYYVASNKNVVANYIGHEDVSDIIFAPDDEQKLLMNSIVFAGSYRLSPNYFKDALSSISWRPGALKFFVNYSNLSASELNNIAKTSAIANTLISNKIDYGVIGSSVNKIESDNLISKLSGNGSFNFNTNVDSALDSLGTYIQNKAGTSSGSSEQYLLLSDSILYNPIYTDYENDPKFADNWYYVHDPFYVDNNNGISFYTNKVLTSPVETFDKYGKYDIQYKAMDDPTGNDGRFVNYRLWSTPAPTSIIVHRKPVASFSVQAGTLYITDTSFDPDFQYKRPDKGIIEWFWQWKKTIDVNWTAGKPSGITQTGNYDFYLRVKDVYGAWSDPYQVTVTVTVTNLNRPPVADFNWTPTLIFEGDYLDLNNLSYDPDSDPLLYQWTIYDPQGVTTSYTTKNLSFNKVLPGTYWVTLRVWDNKNATDVTTKSFAVDVLSVIGHVNHTAEWNNKRINFNRSVTGTDDMPRDYNVFWAGERLVFKADTTDTGISGTKAQTVSVFFPYSGVTAALQGNSEKNLWTGDMWQESFNNIPDGTYKFTFTVTYSNSTVKTHDVWIEISGSVYDYFRFHRIE